MNTPLLVTAYTALTDDDRKEIDNYPDTLVLNLHHAVPEIKALAEKLDAMDDVDYAAADAYETTTDLVSIKAEIENPTSWDHLAAIARNPITSAVALADIVILAHGAHGYDSFAEHYALAHPNVPGFLLDWATGEWAGADANEAAASNPSLTVAQQLSVARAPYYDVWVALVQNKAVDPAIRALVESRSPGLPRIAKGLSGYEDLNAA